MNDWMKTFQFKVNNPCGDEDLKFTTSIWTPEEDEICEHNEAIEFMERIIFLSWICNYFGILTMN